MESIKRVEGEGEASEADVAYRIQRNLMHRGGVEVQPHVAVAYVHEGGGIYSLPKGVLGVFLDSVWFATRTPRYVRRNEPNEIDLAAPHLR